MLSYAADALERILTDAVRDGTTPQEFLNALIGAWVKQQQTLLIQGPPDVDKSHVAHGIGHGAVRNGLAVMFTSYGG